MFSYDEISVFGNCVLFLCQHLHFLLLGNANVLCMYVAYAKMLYPLCCKVLGTILFVVEITGLFLVVA